MTIDALAPWYVWTKSAHLIGAFAWMAGLFYLPRLYVYHCQVAPGSAQWGSGWWWGKLVGLSTMTWVHHDLGVARKRFERDANTRSERGWRMMNEVPTLALILIVVMVIAKPF